MSRHHKISISLLFIITVFCSGVVCGAENNPRPDIFIKVEMPDEGYVGQALKYDVLLYSSIELADANIVRSPNFGGMSATSGQTSGRPTTITIKHKNYYRYNIGKVFLKPSEAGTYKILGGDYEVYVAHQVVTNDFFFGPTRRTQYEKFNVHAPDTKIKIKNLPTKVPENFSGAVGSFEVISWLPPGHINADKDALAIVKISGNGFLSEAEVPSIKSLFGKDARMKEIRRSDNVTQKEGDLNAEIILECTFIPHSTEGELGAISFTFFDPEKGKFRTVTTEPLIWNSDEYTPIDKSKLKVLGI